uniref:7TM_GPCR_Srx domain-containing protein n=1 Tax=Heterorhabditis bacteriophora TaxID=37862 RepID=A0A1I7WZ46_HETBA
MFQLILIITNSSIYLLSIHFGSLFFTVHKITNDNIDIL